MAEVKSEKVKLKFGGSLEFWLLIAYTHAHASVLYHQPHFDEIIVSSELFSHSKPLTTAYTLSTMFSLLPSFLHRVQYSELRTIAAAPPHVSFQSLWLPIQCYSCQIAQYQSKPLTTSDCFTQLYQMPNG